MSLRPIRTLALAALAALTVAPPAADAQLFGGRGLFGGPGLLPSLGLTRPGYGYGGSYSGCGECGMSYAPSAYSTASYGGGCGCGTAAVAQVSNPCAVAVAPAPVATACTYVQPVRETVYRQMPVTKYRSVQKTAQRPVYKTAYEERDVTVYKTVNEQKTVDVPYTTYQTVQSCQTAQVDRSRWQTKYVATQKCAPCQYDSRPGFTGWMNRTGYELRSAFTPKYVARREYVPNVQNVSYAVNRRVPITASRKVTYNVARVVPTVEKQRVAVMKLEQEDYTYTAQVPYTEMQTVAVGTQTRYAYVNGDGTTATASAPTPADRTANVPVKPRSARNGVKDDGRSAGNDNPFKLQSYESQQNDDAPIDRLHVQNRSSENGWTSRNLEAPVLRVAGWRSAKLRTDDTQLSLAAAE